MNRWRTQAVLAGSLALVCATPTYADHTCTGTTCTVSVTVGKRDYGRVVKWCGAASKDVSVSPGSFGGYVECKGSSPWYLAVHVAMRNANDALTPHAEGVTITVNVIP